MRKPDLPPPSSWHDRARQKASGRSGASGTTGLRLSIGIVCFALLLRGPFVAVAPVATSIAHELGVSAATVGVLTGLPALCFAVLTPSAAGVIRRIGPDAAVTAAIFGVGVGVIVRSAGGLGTAIVGTVLIGAFIAVGNVVVPVILHRDVPRERIDVTSAVFSAAISVGGLAASAITVPLATALGWRVALGAWTLIALIAGGAWLVAVGWRGAVRVQRLRPSSARSAGSGGAASASPRRRSLWWWHPAAAPLGLAFAGQSFVYLGLTAWLPALLVATVGLSPAGAGVASSVYQVAAVPGALLAPLLLRWLGPVRAVLVFEVAYVIGPLGMLFAAAGWPIWTTLTGLVQGARYALLLTLVIRISRDAAQAGMLASMTQGFGYLVAAVAPSLLGALHDASDSWHAPMAAVLVASVVCAASTVAAAVQSQRIRSRG